MTEINETSIFLKNIKRGINKGIIKLSENSTKITYFCSREFTTNFSNPEEKVRGSYFVELVLDYDYDPKRIDFEVLVPRRTPSDKADIIIYEDEELKSPYLIVECKKDGISDSEYTQAIEQAFGNANSLRGKFATVVAGITKTAFNVSGFKPNERQKNVIADIPKKYGKTPKYRFIKGSSNNDLKEVSRGELIMALEKSHDTIWEGGKLEPTTAFDEVSKLLFCKLKDEKSTINGKPYKFQIGTHETTEEVFGRIDSIYQEAKSEDAEVFQENINLDPNIVYNVVEHIQEIALNRTDLDTKGVAFERFMEDFFKGKMGQYFTPRQIVSFCVKMITPQMSDLILDPACGSGGFLLNALDYIREFVEENYNKREAWDHWHRFAMNNLYGIEINEKIARICKMNMIIHDDGHTNIIRNDSLNEFDKISEMHKGFKKDFFDIILTNPPFGAVVKANEKDYLSSFDLSRNKKQQKTEILFIERCIEFVKPGSGKIAMVLPDGILSNETLQYVRDFIIDKCQILAIISIPQFAFKHYGAGVKSSLLFLRRKDLEEEIDDYKIFMAIADHIGYDSSGKKDPKNDLDTISKEFHNFLKNSR